MTTTQISGTFTALNETHDDIEVSFTAERTFEPDVGFFGFENIVTDPPGYESECADHLYAGGTYTEDAQEDDE